MGTRRIWDISQPVRPGIPVWPGDTAYGEERTWAIGPGCPVNVGRLTLSTHTGTHADAPLHYATDGAPVGALDLAPYLGPAQVLRVPPGIGSVRPEYVADRLADGVARLLLRTWERFPHATWDPGFTAIDPATVELLADRGVVLIGTDAPSVDPQDSKDLPGHRAIHRRDLRILKGLVLDAVPEGIYELIALPLNLANADAAPVRAVLRELG